MSDTASESVSGALSEAWRILATVPDPELPMLSVVDLGIVRDIEVETVKTGTKVTGTKVTVTLTPTYSGCPATEVIAQDVRAALATRYDEVVLTVRLSPAWTTDWLTDAGRSKLLAAGIAAPNGRALLPVVGGDTPAGCPHCGSGSVEQLAGFGSTPCRALWRCVSCREPFDYFKVH